MSVTKSILFDEVCQRGSIRDSDVLKFRWLYYEDGFIAAPEAEAIIELNDACRVQDPAWQAFFIEAISDYVVMHAEPEGYVNTKNADWLIDRVTQDGAVRTRTGLELLIKVLEKSRWAPESLARLALNTVKDAILSGNQALRGGTEAPGGIVTNDDVDCLRQIVYAFGGDGNVAVTRAEAEVLFAINDATADETENPAWTEFFVKAITSVVMAASGYKTPSREQALRREQWLQSRGDLSLGKVIESMPREDAVERFFKEGFGSLFEGYDRMTDEERELAALDRQRIEIVTGEDVTGDEVDWLVAQIDRDGALTMNEQALLMQLKATGPKLDPRLASLMKRATGVY